MSLFAGIFIILHALVHLLYAGHAMRVLELTPGLTWPDSAWAFSWFLNSQITRILATVFLIVTAIGFLVGGVGVLFNQQWGAFISMGAAGLSILLYLLFWDGKIKAILDKGGLGALISLVLLLVAFSSAW